MHEVDLNTVLAVVIAAVFGPWFAWFAIKALRTGTTGPKNLPATRSASPVLYWIYVTMYSAVAIAMIALAVFVLNYRQGAATFAEMAGLLIFVFCFGTELALIATVTGFYTVQGFRTGTATFIWQGSVDYYSRMERPGWYWATQIQNVLMVVFLGTSGLVAIGVALFLTGGPLLFG